MWRCLAACGMAAMFSAAALLGFGMPLSGTDCGSSFGADNSQGFADDSTFTDTPTNPTLKDTLAKGLKARLPEEFAFVDRVVKMVDHGRLPREMVQSTFLWARKKNVHQFQYFEHGLRLRAEEVGIKL
jgi:hypothetical protein